MKYVRMEEQEGKKKKKGHVIWHVVKTRQNIENNVLGM